MFKSILVKNGFYGSSHTGYEQDEIYIEFDRGLNVLASKNGSGKSHTLECLNYSLFGSSALRSSIQDYKKGFSVETVVELKGNTYKINRNASSAKLSVLNEDGEFEIIVTGTVAVNTHIKELLSYDYKTYSLTNYCSQAGLLSLTDCTPAQLSSLIETISGIESSTVLEDLLKTKLQTLRAERTTLKGLQEDETPEQDDFKYNSVFDKAIKKGVDILGSTSSEVKRVRSELDLAKSFLQTAKEVFKKYDDSVIQLEQLRDYEHISIDILTESLKAIQEKTIKHDSIIKQLNSYKVPSKEYSEEELKEQETLIELNSRYSTYLSLKKQMEEHKVICPNCEHEFYNTDLELNEDFSESPEKPVLTSREIGQLRQWNEVKDTVKALREELKDIKEFLSENPSLEEVDSQVNNYRKFLSVRETMLASKGTLDVFIEEVRSSSLFYHLFKKDFNMKDFSSVFIEYCSNYIKEKEDIIQDLEEQARIIIKYIADKKAYETIKKSRSNLENRVIVNNQNLDLFSNIQDILKTSKREVQTQSLPVINKLASELIDIITSHERTQLNITNEFGVTLDDKDVNVAEMSAQVIANVALRFGLLNTFYRDSLMVFIGDEIDSPLHEDRFNYLESCLNNLVGLGYQIILVSHKDFDRGNIIEIQKL